ncbi:hypothetical protein COO60DRAFT_2138 [Scenedesmus sp. NREL 46B-D3]|nr:hypothetical protein COO60DRAFT_2138 [Scenedesmus sp. NREL 46B-D3]
MWCCHGRAWLHWLLVQFACPNGCNSSAQHCIAGAADCYGWLKSRGACYVCLSVTACNLSVLLLVACAASHRATAQCIVGDAAFAQHGFVCITSGYKVWF